MFFFMDTIKGDFTQSRSSLENVAMNIKEASGHERCILEGRGHQVLPDYSFRNI